MLSEKLTLLLSRMSRLFHDLDSEVARFSEQNAVQCVSSCGACCLSPEVETTVAEMLVLAFDLLSKGEADQLYLSLQNHDVRRCSQYLPKLEHPEQGSCRSYHSRPALCRLFGFSGYRDKELRIRVGGCRNSQAVYAGKIEKIEELLNEGQQSIPFLTSAHARVAAIGGNLALEFLPINEALLRALEIIGLDMQLNQEQHPEIADT